MKKLYLDIETAPNKCFTWSLFNVNISLSQIVTSGYTLCWAAKWSGKKKIMFASIQDGEKKMLEEIHALLEEAEAVIHYNGRKFDIPVLNKEFLKHGFAPPSSYHQIDLIQTMRGRFKLTSNKLDYVAGFLGVGNKVHHKGMELWAQCMDGDPKAWAIMKKYNIQDVRLLPLVYKKILPWMTTHPNEALYSTGEYPMCTNCGSENVIRKGVEHSKTQTYQRFKCKDCGTPLRGRHTILSPEKRRVILTQSKVA